MWGDIDANGDVHSGSGNFYVFKDDTGRYRIEFQHPFAAVPSVTANIRGEGWRMLDNTHVNVIETGHTVITTGHDRGDWADRPFSFQVIGRGATRPTTPTPQPRVF
ncbi:hypothetical protein [Streptomyces sp. enrichment culture]|uniref:hypothetical protein n=1 Tax=Streptomyces sp. enrichment culture TaxID=1795815 RepID=UPI003F557A26